MDKSRVIEAEPVVDCRLIVIWVVVLLLVLEAGCRSPSSNEDSENVTSRLKRLETRMAAIELNADSCNERDKRFERFMTDSERRQADLMMSIRKLEEQMQAGRPKGDKELAAGNIGTAAAPAVSTVKEGSQSQASTKPAAAESPQYHQVQKGDTVYSISRQYNVEAAALRKMNSLESDAIAPGQKLRVR